MADLKFTNIVRIINIFKFQFMTLYNQRYLLSIGIIIFCLLSTQAKPVTKKVALQTARAFMKSKNMDTVNTIQMRMKYISREKNLHSEDSAAYYYIFSGENDKGFVIVSGDDRTIPILGYSEKGRFDEDNIPENMKSWLQGYEDQIRYIETHSVQGVQTVNNNAMPAIQPLLTCTWNQGYPYNIKCPLTESNRQCITGCVATAMAQIIYHHRFYNVTETLMEIPAYTCYMSLHGGGEEEINVTAIPQGSKIDWENILDNYTGEESNVQKEAVANLMAYCGAAVKMGYGTGTSVAYSEDVAEAAIKYFGYNQQTSFRQRSNYTYSAWSSLIYNELANNRPVYYSGSSSGGGHAFVVDGYDGDGLFHINWGWGSWCDGFFLLSVLNPGDNSGWGASSSNDGYSMYQAAVIGMQPETKGSIEKKEDILSASIKIEGMNISCRYYNNTDENNEYLLGIGYKDGENTVHPIKTEKNSTYIEINQNYQMSYEFTNGDFANSGLSTGIYEIVPICRLSEGSDWEECIYFNNTRCTVNYNNDTRDFFFTGPQPIVSVSDYNIDMINRRMTLTLRSNEEDYNDEIFFFAGTSEDVHGTYYLSTGVSIGRNADYELDVSIANALGMYIYVSTDSECKNILLRKSLTDGLIYSNSVYYNYIDESMTSLRVVRVPSDYEGHLSIPEKVNGLPVQRIGAYSFEKCEKLTSVEIPTGVTVIESGAFYFCKSLKSIDIPEGVIKIEKNAFSDCKSIESITLPYTLETIGNWCFNVCGNIKHIYLNNPIPIQVNYSIFNGYVDYETCVLHIPYGTKARYEQAVVWEEFKNIEETTYEKGSLKYNLTDIIVDGHKAQNLEVTCKISDNIDIAYIGMRIGRNDGSGSFAKYFNGTYDKDTHTAHFNIPIKEFFPEADFYAEMLVFSDLAGNEVTILFPESPNEPRQYIHITPPNPDIVPPELDLNRIVVYAEPTNKEAPDGETLVTINFYARDDKSGFDMAKETLLDPQGLAYIKSFPRRDYWETYFDDAPTVWKKNTINFVLPKGSVPGIWRVMTMSLIDKVGNLSTYQNRPNLIFEPDDSETDYVLFANLDENDMLNISLTSETLNGYGYTYRIISDESGEEINGTLTTEQRTKTRAASQYNRSIDISSLPDGKIIVIVNVRDTDNKIVAVRSQSLEKSSGVSGIESRLDQTQGEVKSISYYDAAGRKFNAPVKGLNIVKVTYVNGTVKTMKVNN